SDQGEATRIRGSAPFAGEWLRCRPTRAQYWQEQRHLQVAKLAMEAEEHVADTARALGFPLVGCTPLAELEREQFLTSWLAAGRAGEMRYLTTRTAERLDPRRSYPWARAIVCLAYPYRPPPPPEPEWRAALRGRIAAYALGRDYHDRVGALLEQLIEHLPARWPAATF